MHYYQFHIGDYRAATAHLSNDEDLAYRRLLDMCYDTEAPIPDDVAWVARRIRMAEDTVAMVLKDMFTKDEAGAWTHPRIQKEIENYRQQSSAASKAGKASAAKRALNKRNASDEQAFNDRSTDVQQAFNERTTDVQPTINHKPITNNQIKEANASLSGTKFPDCPHEEILNLWQTHLPHLTQPRTWEGTRRANMRARWIQASKPSAYSPEGYKTRQDGLLWWGELFGYIAKDTRLAAGFETNGRVWKPDLEWVINATNFQKIIDGKYAK